MMRSLVTQPPDGANDSPTPGELGAVKMATASHEPTEHQRGRCPGRLSGAPPLLYKTQPAPSTVLAAATSTWLSCTEPDGSLTMSRYPAHIKMRPRNSVT